ncbi:MAG TPA: hypothetical protein VF765_14375 [Polyangiaceae bacterium]
MHFRAAAILGLALGASGCSGCHEDHPYVPYSIASAQSAAAAVNWDAMAAAPAPSIATADAGAIPAGQPATLAPAGLSRWSVEGVTLEAPQGTVFFSAAVRDFDGDGTSDAFALVRPPEGDDPGQLVYYRGGPTTLSPASTYAPDPSLTRGTGCTTLDRLEIVGARAVLAELGASCAQRTTRAPDRWVALVSATRGVRIAATIADPTGLPTLTVDGDTSDRDGDGLPDIALRVTLEGGGAPFEPGPRVTGTLAWLDRTAGLSRDTAATEASFALLATTAMSKAKVASLAPGVAPFVAQARALWRSVCADGGAPRLVGVAGTGAIGCGAAHSLEDLGLAEARAYATQGDALRAALAIDRATRPPATHTARRITEAQGWLASLAPVATARMVRPIAAVPDAPRGHEPAWGPLAFESSGKLLVRTRAGLVRVDPDAGDEADASDRKAWPPAVSSTDSAWTWIETYDPCDGLSLRASFAPASGDDLRDVPLPVAPPLSDRCSGARGALVHAQPLAWGPGGLEAVVEGEPVLVAPDLSRATPLASPTPKILVVATSSGLLVRAPGRSRLFRAATLDGTYAEQQGCAVSDDGTHVACVHLGKAWVGAWEP